MFKANIIVDVVVGYKTTKTTENSSEIDNFIIICNKIKIVLPVIKH